MGPLGPSGHAPDRPDSMHISLVSFAPECLRPRLVLLRTKLGLDLLSPLALLEYSRGVDGLRIFGITRQTKRAVITEE